MAANAEYSPNPIHIAVINGSARTGNFTGKVLAVVMDELRRHEHVGVDLIDPAALDLPHPGITPDVPEVQQLIRRVVCADGVILGTPLYNGSYSSIIKHIIDNLGYPSALTGKAVAVIGVAASPFGADRAVEHLGDVCRHVQAIVLPEPVSIASVWDAFDASGQCIDEHLEHRLRRVATRMLDYIEKYVRPLVAMNEKRV